MPRQSKITSSKPGKAAPVKEQPEKYYCTRCPRSFKQQKYNFPASQSPIYRENNGYLPVCRHCVDEMYQHYKDVLGNEKSAIRRVCLKFDIYWSDRIYDMLKKNNTSTSRVLSYISRTNLQQFEGKTFDDTLDEEQGLAQCQVSGSDDGQDDEIEISPEIIDFWGSGLSNSFYMELERRKKYWCGENTDGMDIGELAVIKQICMLEVTINRDTALGKSIDKSVNSLNALLGSANLKPVQKKKEESLDAATEGTPFGVWIRKIEDTRPISKPDPELEDVDGIVKYISVWFLGHLCKMLKIENTYSRLYEEEMEKLRVERPEYEGEEEEVVFEDIFSRASSSDEDGGEANDQ